MEAGLLIIAMCLLAILLGLVTGWRSANSKAQRIDAVFVTRPCAMNCGNRILLVRGEYFRMCPKCWVQHKVGRS